MRLLYSLGIPLLAVVTALVLGGIVIFATGGNVLLAYQGLWEGSLGRPQSISETLVWSTPYIFGGLAVSLAFKAGLFNIGVEGQIAVGSLAAVYVRYAGKGVPFPFHLILALMAGPPPPPPPGSPPPPPPAPPRAPRGTLPTLLSST